MCSVTAAMIGLTAAQGISEYQSNRQQTKAQVASYNAQAQAAEQNARIADRQREQIADQYAQKQQQLNARRRLVLGQQAASAGASGLSGAGSVLDANAAANDQWRTDSMNLLSNQRNDTHSAYVNMVNYQNQASAARASASNAKKQGRLSALSTLIGTAASMYGAYKTYGGASKTATAETGWDYAFDSDGNFVRQSPKIKTGEIGIKPYQWGR